MVCYSRVFHQRYSHRLDADFSLTLLILQLEACCVLIFFFSVWTERRHMKERKWQNVIGTEGERFWPFDILTVREINKQPFYLKILLIWRREMRFPRAQSHLWLPFLLSVLIVFRMKGLEIWLIICGLWITAWASCQGRCRRMAKQAHSDSCAFAFFVSSWLFSRWVSDYAVTALCPWSLSVPVMFHFYSTSRCKL